MTVSSFFCVLSYYLSPVYCDLLYRLVVFSDGFSEGTSKNLRDGFPSDEEPYTDSYEYLSDSDLDEAERYIEAGESLSDDTTNDPTHEGGMGSLDQESAQTRGTSSLTTGRNSAEHATVTTSGRGDRPGMTHIQSGKVAIIRDMAATT